MTQKIELVDKMKNDTTYYSSPPRLKDKLLENLYEDIDLVTKDYDCPIDVERIILTLDIGINYIVTDYGGVCGRKKDGKYFMEINKNLPIYRQRFIMAFQLGQMLFHIFGLPGDGEYSIANNNPIINYMNSDYNRKAMKFALELLIPKDKFMKESKKILDKIGYDFDSLLILELSYINTISVIFLVSPIMMKKRLVDLGIFDEKSLKY